MLSSDVSPYNIYNFEQGRMAYVKQDLFLLQDEDCIKKIMLLLTDHDVETAFRVRRQVVNFKKVMYHFHQEAVSVEKDLRQICSLFHASLSSRYVVYVSCVL
jgi:hypothetical protein